MWELKEWNSFKKINKANVNCKATHEINLESTHLQKSGSQRIDVILLNRTSSGMAWIYSLVQPSRKKFFSTEHLKKRYLSSHTHNHHPQTALRSWHCQVRLGGSGRHSHPTFSSTIHSEPQSCQVWERPAARKEIRTGYKEKQRPLFPWWIFMPFPLLFLKKKKKKSDSE